MLKLTDFSKEVGKAIKEFSGFLNAVFNSLLLSIVYFIGIGVASVVAKIFRKKFLETRFSEGSYWSELNLKKLSAEEHYRQF